MKLILFVYFIVAIVILSSCTTNRYIYAPSAPNIPYFNQKGDSKAAAFYSGSGTEGINRRSDGFDLQGAYALSIIGGLLHPGFTETKETRTPEGPYLIAL